MTTPAVEVRAGIPGTGVRQLEDGTFAYPSGTTDFVKLLRERGFNVTYEHPRDARSILDLNAADAWVPVLVFAQAVLEHTSADIIASVIKDYFGRLGGLGGRTLHVKFNVRKPDGEEEEFEADGPGDKVIEAINAFQQSYHE